MKSVTLAHEVDWAGWRAAARSLALEGCLRTKSSGPSAPPTTCSQTASPTRRRAPSGAFTVPRALVTLAETAIQARDPERFALLYRLIWRAHRGEKQLLEMTTDPDVQRVQRLAQAVRRDTHKMRAFVRFREVAEPDATALRAAGSSPTTTSSKPTPPSSSAASPPWSGPS